MPVRLSKCICLLLSYAMQKSMVLLCCQVVL